MLPAGLRTWLLTIGKKCKTADAAFERKDSRVTELATPLFYSGAAPATFILVTAAAPTEKAALRRSIPHGLMRGYSRH